MIKKYEGDFSENWQGTENIEKKNEWTGSRWVEWDEERNMETRERRK
jgi:hypothetical protein